MCAMCVWCGYVNDFLHAKQPSERGFDSLASDCYRAAPFTAWREPHHYLRNLSLFSFVNEGKKTELLLLRWRWRRRMNSNSKFIAAYAEIE